MDLVVLTVVAPAAPARHAVNAQVLTDILWAGSRREDLVEHVSVRAGSAPGTFTVAFLVLPGTEYGNSTARSAAAGLRVCRTAIASSPALAGWEAASRISAQLGA